MDDEKIQRMWMFQSIVSQIKHKSLSLRLGMEDGGTGKKKGWSTKKNKWSHKSWAGQHAVVRKD